MEAAAVAVLEESEAAELVESEEVASAVAALEAVQVEDSEAVSAADSAAELEAVSVAEQVVDSEVVSEAVSAAAPQFRNTSTCTYHHQNQKNSVHKDLSRSDKPRNTTRSSSSKHQLHQPQLRQSSHSNLRTKKRLWFTFWLRDPMNSQKFPSQLQYQPNQANQKFTSSDTGHRLPLAAVVVVESAEELAVESVVESAEESAVESAAESVEESAVESAEESAMVSEEVSEAVVSEEVSEAVVSEVESVEDTVAESEAVSAVAVSPEAVEVSPEATAHQPRLADHIKQISSIQTCSALIVVFVLRSKFGYK